MTVTPHIRRCIQYYPQSNPTPQSGHSSDHSRTRHLVQYIVWLYLSITTDILNHNEQLYFAVYK